MCIRDRSTVVKNSLFKIDKIVSQIGTSGEKGTGFGLLLSKDFVKKHKGTIEIESEEGKGTQLIVTLPETSKVFNEE